MVGDGHAMGVAENGGSQATDNPRAEFFSRNSLELRAAIRSRYYYFESELDCFRRNRADAVDTLNIASSYTCTAGGSVGIAAFRENLLHGRQGSQRRVNGV